MAELSAAREQDEIAHTASKGWMIAGLIGGAVLGAAAVVATGGAALAVVSAAAAGACAAGGIGEVLGSMSWAPRHVTGMLTEGSPNVFINSRAAIRAHLSSGQCGDHSGTVQRVAEGSIKVYINNFPAARVGDHLTCSAEIHSGSPNVFIGGEKTQTDEINPEIPAWVNWTMLAVGVGATAILAGPAIALFSTLGGLGGGTAGNFIGGALFGERSDGQKWSMLLGGLVGGAAGGKGGMKFNAWRNPPSTISTPKISVRRAELNEKFGRTGDINKDINIRANKKLVDDFMRMQGVEEGKIAAYRSGINLEGRITVETVNRGKIAFQNQAPGNWQGNWYSLNKTTPPTKLGINPEGQIRGTDQVVLKEVKAYQAQEKSVMLRSEATPALDTWSVPNRPFQTEGGGIQWFTTQREKWRPLNE
ncbi:PAAR domain-containing protein [Brenneria sp. 4F2]|nr:PAAR domain-containing protein [Brenneria bubanii]